jgi:hypothetical protein
MNQRHQGSLRAGRHHRRSSTISPSPPVQCFSGERSRE